MKHKYPKFGLFFGLLLLVVFSGCGALNSGLFKTESQKKQDLASMVKDFHQALYWQDIDAATSFVRPDIKTDFHIHASERKDKVKYVKTEIQRVNVAEDKDSAEVHVKISYFDIPQYVVKIRREKQEWQYIQGAWFFSGATLLKSPATSG